MISTYDLKSLEKLYNCTYLYFINTVPDLSVGRELG